MTKKLTRPHKKDGPPPKELDEELILKLSSILCTTEEIAQICGCCADVLERRYMHILHQGRAEGKSSIRRAQHKLAMEGNPAMLIWLGKVYLKQREPAPEPGTAQITAIDVTLHPKAIPNETTN